MIFQVKKKKKVHDSAKSGGRELQQKWIKHISPSGFLKYQS
jgi:hypothetical protein